MTNFEKFRCYTAGLPSPDSFIDWTWLSTVSALLQRRVWCPPEHEPIYANSYTALVGKPGIGKGGPIRAASTILKYHKLKDAEKDFGSEEWTSKEHQVADAVLEADIKNAQADNINGASRELTAVTEPLLIPVAADAVTFEALVEYMAKNIRRKNFNDNGKMGLYSHCSTAFCLEEAASLFRKKTEDAINFLIQAYDCSDEYIKRTKTQGNDRILRMCLNFLAGTTPDFMQQAFDDALIAQGFSSRTFFIFATKNRKTVFFRPELTEEQRTYYKDLLGHAKKLSRLYGQVKLEDGTEAFLQDWLEGFNKDPSKWGFKSTKLEPFIARMNIHVMKVAMGLHFGESTEMFMRRIIFEKAIEWICGQGKLMHMALSMGGTNPLSRPTAKILEYLERYGKRNFIELLAQFGENVRMSELEEILDYLQMTDSIVAREEKDEITQETKMYYSVRKI